MADVAPLRYPGQGSRPIVGLNDMLPRLTTLLADRFQLKVHTETREMPIYALVVLRDDGRLGANVTRSTADCSHAEQELAEATARDRGAVASRLEGGQGRLARSCRHARAWPVA
jgi:uncharacterized protein (TIGR03435 family)